MKIAILMRGYSGGGKSTKAKELSKKYDAEICSADDFWNKDGKYVFDVAKLGQAHASCFSKFKKNIDSCKNVIVDNTNLTTRDVEKYLDYLSGTDYQVCIYEVAHNTLDEAIQYRSEQADGKNVPKDRIEDMYNKFYSINIKKMASEHYTNINFVDQKEL